MSISNNKKVNIARLGQYSEWVKRFNVDEYINNRPLIEKLYEEKQLALVDATECQESLEAAYIDINELNLRNQSLQHRLANANRGSSVVFILSLLAALLLGLGANISTGKPDDKLGWFLIVCGVALEVTAFLIKPRG